MMVVKRRQFVTRAEHSQSKQQEKGKFAKMDRLLNVLIAIVSLLIVMSLIIIFTMLDEPKQVADTKANDIGTTEQGTSQPSGEDEQQGNAGAAEQDETDDETPAKEQQEPQTDSANTSSTVQIQTSNDPLVVEVQVDPNWKPFITAQTGPHTSVYAEGHIDYEEKLGAIYEVTGLLKESSIIWSIKSNGNADASIAVISSNDRAQKYRVSLEWVTDAGWKPVKVETLNTLEGAY